MENGDPNQDPESHSLHGNFSNERPSSSSSLAAAIVSPKWPRPRKSILKHYREGENATMPIFPSRNNLEFEQMKPGDRRVSFADKVQLHKIDIVSYPGEPLADTGLHNNEVDQNMSSGDDDDSFSALESDADKIVSVLRRGEIDKNGYEGIPKSNDLVGSNKGLAEISNENIEGPQINDAQSDEESENSMELTEPPQPKFFPNSGSNYTQDVGIDRHEQEHEKSDSENANEIEKLQKDSVDTSEGRLSPKVAGEVDVGHPFYGLEEHQILSESVNPETISREHFANLHPDFDFENMSDLLNEGNSGQPVTHESSHAPSLTSSEDFLDGEEDMEFTSQISKFTQDELTMDLTLSQAPRVTSHETRSVGFENSVGVLEPAMNAYSHHLGHPEGDKEVTMEFTKQIETNMEPYETGNKPTVEVDDVTMDFTAPQATGFNQRGYEHRPDGPEDASYSRDQPDEEVAMELTQPVSVVLSTIDEVSENEYSLGRISPVIVKSQDTEVEPSQPSQATAPLIPQHENLSISHQGGTEQGTDSKETVESVRTPTNPESPDGDGSFHRTEYAEGSRKRSLSEGSQDSSSSASNEENNYESGSLEDANVQNKTSLGPAMKPSPTKRHQVQPVERVSDEIEAHNGTNDWKGVSISPQDFLRELGITFYDDLEIETDLTSKLQSLSSDTGNHSNDQYYRANVLLPLAQLHELSCKELSTKIQQGKILLKEFEERCMQNNPELFHRYLSASPYDQMAMKAKLHLVKEYTKHQATEVWNQWRKDLMTNVIQVYQDNLEVLDNDEQFLKDALDILNKDFQKILRGVDSVRFNIKRFKEIKNRSGSLNVEEVKALRAQMADLNQKMISQNKRISEKQKSIKALQVTIENSANVVGGLRKQIHETEEQLSKTKHFNTKEIEDLQVTSKILSACTGLTFVRDRENFLDFELDSKLLITIATAKLDSSSAVTCTLLDSRKSGLLNADISSIIPDLIKNISATSAVEKIDAIRQIWRKLRRIDFEVYRIVLRFPVLFQEVSSKKVAFKISYLCPESRIKIDFSVSISLESVLEYPAGVSFDANFIKGEGDKADLLQKVLLDVGDESSMFSKVGQ